MKDERRKKKQIGRFLVKFVKKKEKIMLDRFDHKNDNNNDVSGQIIQYDTRLSWTNFVII